MKISTKYGWMDKVPGAPKVILEAVKLGKLDTTEYPGPKSNPEIMALAKEAGVSMIYKNDEVAWCAVAMVVILLRAGKVVPFLSFDRLRAKSFISYGNKVPEPMYGDILVFSRKVNGKDIGGHVGIYVGEDDTHYHTAGGNQGNEYSVVRIAKNRMVASRRPFFATGQPAGVMKIYLDPSGVESQNEA